MNRMLDLATAVGGSLIIESFSGREEMSRLFEYRLDMLSEKPDLDAAQLLGTNATVSLEIPGGRASRHFNGYFSQFSALGAVRTPAFEGRLGYRYQGTLSPWLWFLTRTSTSQIFTEQKVLDVIDKVFKRWPTLREVDLKVADTEKRDYITQYRETDFNFISRLAEHAGLYYYFTHENGKHKLVLLDDMGKHVATPDLKSLEFDAENPDTAGITHWDPNWELQPGAYAANDFNPLQPRTSLLKVKANEGKGKNAGFELYDYPAEHKDVGWGDTYAKLRSEEQFSRHHVLRGTTQQRLVQVGHKVSIAKHPVSSRNGMVLVVGQTFTATNNLTASAGGQGATFRSDFSAIPATVQYRAARVSPKPTIAGPQTAFVVGPAGEEIYTDEHGRVRVQFHWDRYAKGNDADSCWLRVSQEVAGKGWGAVSIPRVGQEVVVSFLEGDPDRPLVTGRVYNGDTPPPYKLPDEKARTGIITRTYRGGNDDFNELRFDDKTGAEQVYLQAQKNLDVRVKAQSKEFIGDEAHRIVTKDLFEKHKADHHVDTTGDHNNKIGGSLSFSVSQDTHLKASKALVDTQQEIHLKAGMKVVIEAGTQISLKASGSFIDIGPAGVAIKGTMVMINSGGAAGSGSGASPIAAKAAKDAITSKGGAKDEVPKARTPPTAYSAQATSFKTAAANGTAFCEVCQGC